MKKKFVIFFNCHGNEILKQLNTSEYFTNRYDCIHIPIYIYLQGYPYENETDLTEEHKDIIRNADVLLLQYIKKDRKHIKHTYVKKIVKNECKVIMLPHYTFYGYNYPYKIMEDNNISEDKTYEELKEYFDNLLLNDKDNIIRHADNEIEKIRLLDEFSDVKCYDFVKENYKKTLLFMGNTYPTYKMFQFISKNILAILEDRSLNEVDLPGCWSNYAGHMNIPIYENVGKYLELEFNFRKMKLSLPCNIIEYTLCRKRFGGEFLILQNRKKGKRYIKALTEIIDSKMYR